MKLINDSVEGKTLLVVHTGTIKKKFIFQKLKKLGITVIVAHKEKNWAQPYVDDWIITDITNYRETLENIKSYLRSHPDRKIDGAVTFWEESVLLTAKICDTLGLIGIPFAIAKRARNKFLFREFCEFHNIRVPGHRLIKRKEDLVAAGAQLGFPLVIKPIYGSSSAFVIRVENQTELLDSYDYIKKNISSYDDAAEWDELEVLVEEYVDGDEVDVDILLQNGKIKFYSISDNFNKMKDSFFIDSGQSIPSSLPLRDQEQLVNLAEEVLEKLGIQNACIHFEAKATKEGPVPIEVNLRMGGDYVYSYIKAAWNLDFIEYIVKIAFGIFFKINKPSNPKKYIIGWDLHANYSGMIVEMDIDKKLPQHKNLDELHIHKHIGDSVLVPPEGYEYMGWLTVTGDNLLDAQDNLNYMLSKIKYKIVKFNSDSSMGKTQRRSRFSSAVLTKDTLLKAAKIEHIKLTTKRSLKHLHVGILTRTQEQNVNGNGKHKKTNGNGGSSLPLHREIQYELASRGYAKVSTFFFDNVQMAMQQLKSSDVDIVINATQRLDNPSVYDTHAAAVLDMLQIPYIGSDMLTLATCIDKIRVKKILEYHDIPTAPWDYVYELDDEIDDDLEFPLIVKPANKDHSIGILQESVVTNKRELHKQLKRIINELSSPALIEEYISGDEYQVSIIGNDDLEDVRVLPPERIMFNSKRKWHILDFQSKWHKSRVSHYTVQQPPKNMSRRLLSLITEIALDTYNILECQDYGVVEIKIDENNNPYVLELNPNPQLDKDGAIFRAGKFTGMDYGDFLEELLMTAINRYKSVSTKNMYSYPIQSLQP